MDHLKLLLDLPFDKIKQFFAWLKKIYKRFVRLIRKLYSQYKINQIIKNINSQNKEDISQVKNYIAYLLKNNNNPYKQNEITIEENYDVVYNQYFVDLLKKYKLCKFKMISHKTNGYGVYNSYECEKFILLKIAEKLK